jgi:hypothetical protein
MLLGEAKREAPVRTEPHPTRSFAQLRRGLPRFFRPQPQDAILLGPVAPSLFSGVPIVDQQTVERIDGAVELGVWCLLHQLLLFCRPETASLP